MAAGQPAMGTVTATLGTTVSPAVTDRREQGLGETLEHQVVLVAGAQHSPSVPPRHAGAGGDRVGRQRASTSPPPRLPQAAPGAVPQAGRASATAGQGPVLPSASAGLSWLVMVRA